MPVDDPQFGEVWTTTDVASSRIMQGILADVSPTRVIFVSLTGNRVAVPRSRLRTNWNFVQATPRRNLPGCERLGCSNNGMIEYTRHAATRSEYVCPKHTPTGVQCRITTHYEPPLESRKPRSGFECRSMPCPACGDPDPAEDVRIAAHPARIWLCPACSNRWATIPRVRDEDQDIANAAYRVRHELLRVHLQVDSVLILSLETWQSLRLGTNPHDDLAVRSATFQQMQFSVDLGAAPEQIREHFHAIVRIRTNISRPQPVQRLGGSPNRGGVIGSTHNPVRPAPVPADPMVFRATGLVSPEQAQAEVMRRAFHERQEREDLFETPTPAETPIVDIAVDKESMWVQRASGDLVVVIDVLKATDGTDAISFRRSTAEDLEPSVTMTKRDFIIHHRKYSPSSDEAAKSDPPMIEVSIDQEWECQDGSAMQITQVDFKREIVFGDDLKTKKHRQIPFAQFAAGRWRRIIRRSVYDRIRNPEFNLDSGGEED